MRKLKECKVDNCEQFRPLVDDLFCRTHRERWIIATKHLNSHYDDKEKELWIKMFCKDG